ncbi:hypothetical protein GQ600_6826 [Phytophthora cactorum]|nr:hypothetical protein GQ600_6826 [Phytophthora cactorum]
MQPSSFDQQQSCVVQSKDNFTGRGHSGAASMSTQSTATEFLLWKIMARLMLTETCTNPASLAPFRISIRTCLLQCGTSSTSYPIRNQINWSLFDPSPTSALCVVMRTRAVTRHLLPHKDHPFTVECKRAKINKVSNKIAVYNTAANGASDPEPKQKKQHTLLESIAVSADEVRILITRWLLSAGLPHTL